MKKYVIMAILALFAIALSSAQNAANKYFIGTSTAVGGGLDLQYSQMGNNCPNNAGGFGFYKVKYEYEGEKEDGPKVTSVNFSPRVGYFFTDELVGGVKASFFYGSSEMNEDGFTYSMSSTAFSGGPFLRYYFGTSKVKPFIEGDVLLGSMTEKEDDYDDWKTTTFYYGGGVGIAVLLNNNISFDALAGYASQTWKDTDDDSKIIINGFGISIGMTFFL